MGTKKETVEAISMTESKRLIQLEKIIKEGEQTFVAVGNALLEIRDARLYRSDFSTFETYCEEKWGWSSRRGNQLIQATKVLNSLPETVRTYVPTETATREISKIPPKKRAAVIEKIVQSGKPVTAKTIAATAPPPRKPSAPPAKKKPAAIPEPEITPDEIGRAIPDALIPLWARRHELKELVSALSRVHSALKDAQDGDELYRSLDIVSALNKSEALLQEIKCGIPYSLCVKCQGKLPEDCSVCKHTGFISKFTWDHQTAKEDKEMILKTLKK